MTLMYVFRGIITYNYVVIISANAIVGNTQNSILMYISSNFPGNILEYIRNTRQTLH